MLVSIFVKSALHSVVNALKVKNEKNIENCDNKYNYYNRRTIQISVIILMFTILWLSITYDAIVEYVTILQILAAFSLICVFFVDCVDAVICSYDALAK